MQVFFFKEWDIFVLQLPKDCRTCINNKIFVGFAYLVPTITTFTSSRDFFYYHMAKILKSLKISHLATTDCKRLLPAG
jgi:hypothetical protein